jgi:hypothetical protein
MKQDSKKYPMLQRFCKTVENEQFFFFNKKIPDAMLEGNNVGKFSEIALDKLKKDVGEIILEVSMVLH